MNGIYLGYPFYWLKSLLILNIRRPEIIDAAMSQFLDLRGQLANSSTEGSLRTLKGICKVEIRGRS